jgi:hypothetical protein
MAISLGIFDSSFENRVFSSLEQRAQSGHHNRPEPCPLSGVKRTSQFDRVMSGFDPERTLRLPLGPTEFG